ncbi:1,4-dihydroxy-2-naphthoate polyprenyltransferase [Schaalia suimastitidis]|uniref:1,4-dihydroxy-2-naphthoate polyprenyltransferase n=1 Tax=Schaalia suimastitidis TaxID=121163 RepID=UPI0004164939|nr:1,4-dihydroxy-2-naphthoate polyprenyltransferase [Schaalia suimastitidis]
MSVHSTGQVTAAWIEGARLRTLPAAAAPVAVGTSAAYFLGAASVSRATLALLVALALQIGVNYANDYSDGIRGTDDERQGPPRLTGGGMASPRTVLAVAVLFFLFAGIAGLALLYLSGQWWLLVAGLAAVVAAWFYTGGRRPYGYMGVGLSEVMVFVFFGLMACVGTTWTQAFAAPWWLWLLASALGLMSVAMLMVNNLRDEAGDRLSGKRTLVVRLGGRICRGIYAACLLAPSSAIALLSVVVSSPVMPLIAATLWLVVASRPVFLSFRAREAHEWIQALKATGLVMLLWAVVVSLLLWWWA